MSRFSPSNSPTLSRNVIRRSLSPNTVNLQIATRRDPKSRGSGSFSPSINRRSPNPDIQSDEYLAYMLSISDQETYQFGSFHTPVAVRNESNSRRSSPSTPGRLTEDELLAIRLTEEEHQRRQQYGDVEDTELTYYHNRASIQNPNIDSMSYEELLELESKVGAVEKGVSSVRMSLFPVRVYSPSPHNDNTCCSICQEDYVANDRLRTLPCFHGFHQRCIDVWLSKKTTCPFCMQDPNAC